MTDGDVIRIMRGHLESLFPKSCPKCGRTFATLKDYIAGTQKVGRAHSYDAEIRDWTPSKPLGLIASVRCPCGNTLSLSTTGLDTQSRLALLQWLKAETARRGMGQGQLLELIRAELRSQVLSEPG